MDERITHLREPGMPDAAGLVLASDQDDARAYAEIVERVTGEAPVLILSDDPKASDKIAAFTHGTERIAVCVRMVSEGVDVPRAACLAWMTSYRTPLFFAQGVGRVVRARGAARVGDGVPARGAPAARAGRRARGRAQPRHPAAGGRRRGAAGRRARAEAEPGERDRYELVDADAAFAHVLHGGRAVVAGPTTPTTLSEDDEDFLGLPGILSPEQMAALLARRDAHARRRADGSQAAPQAYRPPSPAAPTVGVGWRAGGRAAARGQPAGRRARRPQRHAARPGARRAAPGRARAGVGGGQRRACWRRAATT